MSNVVYTHNLAWKLFNIDLAKVRAALTQYLGFCGLSADNNLRAHFTQIPTDEQIAEIDSYWESITADSPEAASYMSKTDKATALAVFKQKLLTKNFEHFTVTDRKILLGETLDDTDWAVITE